MRRPFDQLRTIVERYDPHSRRKARLQRSDLLLDSIDHLEGVYTVAGNHYSPDRLLAVLIQGARAECVSQFHVRHVSYVQRCTIWRANDDVLDIAYGLNQTNAPYHCPLACLLDYIAANVIVGTLNRFYDRGQRY